MTSLDQDKNIWKCIESISELSRSLNSMFESLEIELNKKIHSIKRMSLGNKDASDWQDHNDGWIDVARIHEYPLQKQKERGKPVGWLYFIACIGNSSIWKNNSLFTVPFLEIGYSRDTCSWIKCFNDDDYEDNPGPQIVNDHEWTKYFKPNDHSEVLLTKNYRSWDQDPEDNPYPSWHFAAPLLSIKNTDAMVNNIINPAFELLNGNKNEKITNAFKYRLENNNLEVLNDKS